MASSPENTHARALCRRERGVGFGCLLAPCALAGLQIAISAYSGPSILLGLGIAGAVAVSFALAIVYLPETAREALLHLIGLFLC